MVSIICCKWKICFNCTISGYGGDCPEGVPVEFGLLSILAAFGVSFGILYMALTIILGGRRRRDLVEDVCEDASGTFGGLGCHLEQFVSGEESGIWLRLADLLWHGESVCGRVKLEPQSSIIFGLL